MIKECLASLIMNVVPLLLYQRSIPTMYLLKVIVFNNDDNDGITDNCQMYAL